MKKDDLITIAIILLLVYWLTRPLKRRTNEAHVQSMAPSVRGTVRAFLRDIEALGYTPKIRDSVRTYQQQAAYKRQDSRNAAPGHSSHETGIAIDMDLYKGGRVFSKRTPRNAWVNTGVPALAKKYGIRWGGNFRGYPDNNHFDFLP